MPITVKQSGGGVAYASALIGDYQTLHVKVDLKTLTSKQVDARGNLKPNVVLTLEGGQVVAYDPEEPEVQTPCVTVEATKVADSNSVPDLTAAGEVFVACAVNGVLNRHVMEDVLDRALTAPEIEVLTGPHSRFVLSNDND